MRKTGLILALSLCLCVFIGVSQAAAAFYYGVSAKNLAGPWADKHANLVVMTSWWGDVDAAAEVDGPVAVDRRHHHHNPPDISFWFQCTDARDLFVGYGFFDVKDLLDVDVQQAIEEALPAPAEGEPLTIAAGTSDPISVDEVIDGTRRLFILEIPLIGYVSQTGAVKLHGGANYWFGPVTLQLDVDSALNYLWFKLSGYLEGTLNIELGGFLLPLRIDFMASVNATRP